ncbi:sigma-E factor negative regulatory protein [Ottowia testudinis]|uniref:sigma-E factor negative regulatory protein n=1 Tax=Ottowia testudinis TaxID=2816950 RepID=UPI001FB055E5|nr:sigma-E factor negative regulatory protein [Ottowia testudinis]
MAFDREAVSALMDGQLVGAEASAVLQCMATTDARECWHVYHLVGDVLRSSDLAACGHDAAFVTRLNARLKYEARPAERLAVPLPDIARPAANDGVFRWKLVAGLASFAAVAAIGWGTLGGIGPQPGSGAQLAQGGAPARSAQVMALSAPVAAASETADAGAVMLRDARLDELLAAHRQTAGASALGQAAGFLRNATFEGSGR